MINSVKVGVFVAAGVLVTAICITILGKVQLRPGYTFDVIFKDISGLSDDSPVRIAGVKVGKVIDFEITDDGAAKVKVWIENKYPVRHGCSVRVVSTGLIGTKYLQLSTGDPKASRIKSGETIEGISSVSIEEILESLNPAEGEKPFGKSLREIFDNVNSITRKIDMGIEDENDIKDIVKNIKQTAKNIRKFTDSLDGKGADLRKALEKFPGLVDSAKNAFDELEKLAKKLNNSNGAFEALISDEKVAGDVRETVSNLKKATNSAKKALGRITDIKTYWDYRLRYNTGDEKYRSDLGIKIAPNENKFYYLGVSNIKSTSDSGYDVSASTGEKITSADAYLGRVFGPVTIYGGLIKSAGGVGISVAPLKALSLESQAYRFDRKIEGKTTPWVDVTAKIRFTSWLYANAGVSDALESNNFQVGLNLIYNDEDLPYLFGLGSLAAVGVK
ncbi:MCE family protein [bacterium]|nr:MCE family protein [bacterium]MBU3954872.1 MCE family protein [bacterium]